MVARVSKDLRTRGQGDTKDLTGDVADAVAGSGATAGIVTVFVVGSTAGVTTIEHEPGAVSDLDRAFERIAPRDAEYAHHLRWGDDNGSSHVRAAMLGPSLTFPSPKVGSCSAPGSRCSRRVRHAPTDAPGGDPGDGE